MSGAQNLSGKTVLVVEDQYLIADDLTELFAGLGATVLGPHASSAASLKAIAAAHVDYAVLDIQLAGNAVYPLAEELRRRSVPFLFLTGYDGDHIRADFASTPTLTKPYSEDGLTRLITSMGWLAP